MDENLNKEGGPSRAKVAWDRLWESLGVEPDKRGFWSAWVMKFGKFLAPKPFYQATLADVEAFYRLLVDGGFSRWAIAGVGEGRAVKASAMGHRGYRGWRVQGEGRG